MKSRVRSEAIDEITDGTQTSNAWMIRIGWVLTGLSSANMIGDSLGKILPWHPALLLEEVQRLGESEIPLILLGILQFTVGVVYLIPRTSILRRILMTGFLGGAEAIQIRVSGSGAFLNMLPRCWDCWHGVGSGCGTRDFGT